jgi:hypothetical protein
LEQASGEWICFLGADDFFWDIQSLELMAKKLQTLPHYIRVAYGQVMLLGKDDENLYQVGDPWESVKDRFKQIMCIPHQGVMHRSSLFEQYGNFDESFRISGDYELLLRELKAADAVFIPNLIVAGMRQGGISSNPTASLTLLHEIRRAQREHDIFLPGHVWLTVTARVYLRLLLWRLLGEQRSRQALDLGRRVMGLHPFWTKT